MGDISIAYNAYYGEFRLSTDAISLYNKKRTMARLEPVYHYRDIVRTDPFLIEVIEELGKRVNLGDSYIEITNIPSEYSSCYEIVEQQGGIEKIICDPKNLVAEKLNKLNLKKFFFLLIFFSDKKNKGKSQLTNRFFF